MTQQPAQNSASTPRSSRRRRSLVAVMVVLELFLGAGLSAIASAVPSSAEPRAQVKVKLRVKVSKEPFLVGERPVVRVTVKTKRPHQRATRAKGRIIVKALGERERVRLRRGKARVRLPELTQSGTVRIRVTFKGKHLPKRKVTTRITVQAAEWEVPDAALRAEIRAALGLPEGQTLTLADAAALDNTNGASLFFGDVRTAAGLELATNLTVLTSYTAAHAQDSRGLDNIVGVNGSFWISNAVQDASYPELAHVGGDVEVFNIDAERLRTISMPELVDAKSIQIDDRPLLASISLPRLTTVRGDLDIEDDPALGTVDLPSLTTVSGSVDISDLDTATAVRLPSLADTAGIAVGEAPRVQGLDLGRLAVVNGELRIASLPMLGGLSAPALRQVAGGVTVYGLGSITQLRMPVLEWSHGSVLLGIGPDFPALPRDGSAVSFPAFDVTQATGFDFSVSGASPVSSDKSQRWQEFLAHFGVA